MKGIERIEKDGALYAIVAYRDASSDNKYNFITPGDFPFQFGINFYQGGETIKAHYHLKKEIRISEIHEFILIAEGKVKLTVYDTEQQPIRDTVLQAGDTVLLVKGGHGFEVLEAAKFVEIKQGPYNDKEQDKVVFG